MVATEKTSRKKLDRARMRVILNDAGDLIWRSRTRLLIGLPLHLIGGCVTALIATGILFYLSPRLATVILIASAGFIGVLVWAFKTARPLFKKRGELNANVTGRLNETLSGIRVVKAYTAERRE